jgi:hypothetical protein
LDGWIKDQVAVLLPSWKDFVPQLEEERLAPERELRIPFQIWQSQLREAISASCTLDLDTLAIVLVRGLNQTKRDEAEHYGADARQLYDKLMTEAFEWEPRTTEYMYNVILQVEEYQYRPILTAGGYLGLASHKCIVGDRIAMFDGSSSFYACGLRPTALGESEEYELIGYAYVHAFEEEEYQSKLTASELESIILC